ncbi:MAG: PEP-CTERM sorting domain-containing protein [Okeania sp. SIO3I5]|uniref:PEP-CTERM sorting domain-containing protein n=1 Tax=Okeania sp. SIO3I5 TaxID=2607805 RepID=UPI0013B892B5|nr:PEP-CTERM sorting domain-containing protein [Okeania sp. SIO3I5]NEQ41426.1 PEP-CTERM sorting domain-containing protein [Okeania sp. SIO3I5]
MKTQLSILLTAIAGTVISAIPAQAFYFGTYGIKFDEDTNINFEFNQSYGGFKTDLNVYEVTRDVYDNVISIDEEELLFGEVKAADASIGATGAPGSDPIGTVAGGTVPNSLASFTFEAGKEYTLGIVNYGYWQDKETEDPYYTTVYSTSELNSGGTQQAVFGSSGGDELFEFTDASLFTQGDLYAGMVDISFDDRGNGNDKDFQDFTIKATLVKSTPEPTVLAGLSMIAGGMFLSRFHKKQK